MAAPYNCWMTYDEFQRQLGKAGLTAREFAALLRMNPASISNYTKKVDVPSHLAVIAVLLGTLADNHIDFRGPLKGVDITSKKPRGAGTTGQFGGNKPKNLEATITRNEQ
jgi:hypothetical protein